MHYIISLIKIIIKKIFFILIIVKPTTYNFSIDILNLLYEFEVYKYHFF
jgi:hypothetical protein